MMAKIFACRETAGAVCSCRFHMLKQLSPRSRWAAVLRTSPAQASPNQLAVMSEPSKIDPDELLRTRFDYLVFCQRPFVFWLFFRPGLSIEMSN